MTTYQGWKNYQTWNVALWIDNEQGLYHRKRLMVAHVLEQHRGQDRVHRLADMIKGWVGEMMPQLEASMFSDILQAALDDVDYHEIATNWLEDEDQ